MPMFMLGFKDGPAGSGNLAISRELTAELACELLAGHSSPLYARLYSEGLINKSFETGYMGFPGGAAYCFPEKARTRKPLRLQSPESLTVLPGRGGPRSFRSAEESLLRLKAERA